MSTGLLVCMHVMQDYVCVCEPNAMVPRNLLVIEALDSWSCGYECKSHQVQFASISQPTPTCNEDLALAGDGQDHCLCLMLHVLDASRTLPVPK